MPLCIERRGIWEEGSLCTTTAWELTQYSIMGEVLGRGKELGRSGGGAGEVRKARMLVWTAT